VKQLNGMPPEFDSSWYDEDYFKTPGGKKFHTPDGKVQGWSYASPTGWWEGCRPIAKAWKTIFNPATMLDAGCGRGAFTFAARELGIEAYGFDFSKWAIDNLCPGCRREWFKVHDATKPWPYRDRQFDLVTVLDFMEHIYCEDLDFVEGELFRVAGRWVFLQIAVAGSGGLQGEDGGGYVLEKGKPVPVGLEGCAVAGHVTVKPERWWLDRFERFDEWQVRRDMVNWFTSLVPREVIKNWLQNSILVLERM